jgi:Uma2 family endonuclease
MAGVSRFTIDDLRSLPDWGVRGEVVDGRLVLGPPPSRRHDRAVHNLTRWLRSVLPAAVRVAGDHPLRLPDGDAPVPDLVVTGLVAGAGQPVPAEAVHTVVEVVCATGRFLDRVWKRDRYAEAGIPCYWRVELSPWPGYRGPSPVIVVRLREPGGWREVVAAAGRVRPLPLVYGRGPGRVALAVPVRLDPGTLLVRHASTR